MKDQKNWEIQGRLLKKAGLLGIRNGLVLIQTSLDLVIVRSGEEKSKNTVKTR